MTMRPLSSETVHASCVAMNGRAVLITGKSGSGKSDLALRLIDRGFNLVSDDQTIIHRAGALLLASAPATIAGKLEIRGIGIVEIEPVKDVPVALIVDLTSEFDRLPEEMRERQLLGVPVPLITVDALTSSATAKVVIGLDKLGLNQ